MFADKKIVTWKPTHEYMEIISYIYWQLKH